MDKSILRSVVVLIALIGVVSVVQAAPIYDISQIGAQVNAAGNVRWFVSKHAGDYLNTLPFSRVKEILSAQQIQWFLDNTQKSPYGSCLGSSFKQNSASVGSAAIIVPSLIVNDAGLKNTEKQSSFAGGNVGLQNKMPQPSILTLKARMRYLPGVVLGMGLALYSGKKCLECLNPVVLEPQGYMEQVQNLVKNHPYSTIGAVGAVIACAYVVYKYKDTMKHLMQQSVQSLIH